ncbi:hypothetical protein KIH07_14425 [Hydrogenophaga taeniospiralis]|jgi:hypothetical protein|nr:hypothetical protein [Hydrogenophaga taeniospiralis]MCB4364937.1 hypothetical protein [Hydrogenophaga taeniospiralis]
MRQIRIYNLCIAPNPLERTIMGISISILGGSLLLILGAAWWVLRQK